MKLFRKRDFITIGFILLFSAAAITLFYTILKPTETLPIYQPAEVNEKLVDTSIIHVSKYHKISDFKLINQNGEEITQEFYKNKIYVADFFFTTCQDICPIMTKNMYRLQEELKEDNDILFLSHTVIPEIDTVQQLKKYAVDNKIDESKWNLVTGDKKQIYELARKSYLAVEDAEFGEYDMIHTENFMLIDKKRQIRGFYDGTNDFEIDRLLSDIEILKKISEWPKCIDTASVKLEPHRIPTYLYDLASLFHSYWNLGKDYPDKRFINDQKIITNDKLVFLKVISNVIKSGMDIVGVTTPEKM